MSETFLVTHDRIDLSQFTIRSFSSEFYALARIIAKTLQPIPVIPNYRGRVPVGVVVAMYDQILEAELAHVRDQLLNKEVWVLEALILFGIYKQLPKKSGGRVVAIIGSMMQHRLTQGLIGIHHDEQAQLMRLVERRIPRKSWTKIISGAQAASNTLVDLSKRDQLCVYLPTVREDVIWGIDLYTHLTGKEEGACISIKSQLGLKSRWHNSEEQVRSERRPLIADWQKITRGTNTFNAEYCLDWQPALMRVGEKEKGFHRTPHQHKQRFWTNRFIQWLEERSNKLSESQPTASH